MNKSELLNRCGIGELYHKASFDLFSGDPEALTTCKNYANNLDIARQTGVGLFLFGPNGTGKTYLACAVLIKAMESERRPGVPYTIYKASLTKMVTAMTKGWYSDEERLRFEKRFLNSDFLYIDDIEKGVVGEANLQKAALDMVLRERVERKRPTLFSSNEDAKILTAIFGESIGSLLRGNVISVMVKGNDYRGVENGRRKWNDAMKEKTSLVIN